ncbi:MAG: rhombosortase [bacterium]|jgi:rhomboid family GlyGly-CTERM serine protease|nr:rhombosortase [bacterium]
MKRRELLIYVLAIFMLNITLAKGRVFETMMFLPEKVLDGQWWRFLTHPFVHVSWYHLLLDGAAFLLLYTQLAEPSRLKRTWYVLTCGAFSLLSAAIALPASNAVGYCGLSGIGHGLMAVCALEMINSPSNDRTVRKAGFWCLGLLSAKCLVETVTGTMVFTFAHGSLIGSPIALAHVGGIIGGLVTYVVFNRRLVPADAFIL